MANANTIRRQILGTQQLTIASAKAASSTTPTAFVLNNNGLTLTGGGVIPLSVGVTGLYKGTGAVIKVLAQGAFVGSADDDLTLTLYIVPASVIANPVDGSGNPEVLGGPLAQDFTGWVSVCATTLQVIDGVNGSFYLEVDLQMSASGAVSGQFIYEVANLPSPPAYAIIPSIIAATSLPGGEADLNFVLVRTSASGGTSVVNLENFEIDAA